MPSIQPLINPELQKSEQGSAFVELFSVDATAFGGSLFFFCNELSSSGGNVSFGGVVYQAVPVQLAGWDMTSTGASAKPTLSVSNIGKILLAAVISQGDLVGAKVERKRTFAKFLDGGATPNSTAFIGPDKMVIEQKTFHDRSMIQFQLSSVMDRMGLKIPRRQVLKDPSHLGCAFPGVSRSRVG